MSRTKRCWTKSHFICGVGYIYARCKPYAEDKSRVSPIKRSKRIRKRLRRQIRAFNRTWMDRRRYDNYQLERGEYFD